MCLAMGGRPSLLGRSERLQDYVKHGRQSATVEITLCVLYFSVFAHDCTLFVTNIRMCVNYLHSTNTGSAGSTAIAKRSRGPKGVGWGGGGVQGGFSPT